MIDKKTNNFKGCTVNSGSDFSTVKVADRLWVRKDSYEGPAVVYALLDVTVTLNFGADLFSCYYDGKMWSDGPQVLFYSKVEIVPPPRPVRMVKKTVMVRPYLDPHTQTIEVTSHLNCVLDYCGPIQKIEIEVWDSEYLRCRCLHHAQPPSWRPRDGGICK